MFRIKFCTKKSVGGHMSISPKSRVRGLERLPSSKYWMDWNGKADSLQASTQPKILIISKNASDKSCRALNFLQKSHWAHMSTPSAPKSGSRVLQRLVCFKYYICCTEIGKYLLYGSSLPKLPIISENTANKSCWALNFVQKSQYRWDCNISIVFPTLQKLLIISKNAWNESCAELNFLQKTQWKYISIYLRSGARGLQRFALF